MSVLDEACAVIEKRAEGSPLLVVLDELQRADPPSVLVLRQLVLRLAAYPVLWLLAARLGEAGALLGRLLGPLATLDGATRIELHPLPARAVAQLVGDVTGAAPDAELLSWSVGTGSLPRPVIELVEDLGEQGAIEVAHGRSRLATGRTPSFEAIVADRLGGLSAEARQVVEVAAVLGKSFLVHDLACALGVAAARLLAPVREVTAAGLIDRRGSEYLAFRRELVRQAVYQGLEGPIRIALHRQIGEFLLDRGGAPTRAAAHMIQGARLGDRRVLAALDQAVDETQRSSSEAAADLAGRALELTEPGDPSRPARTAVYVRSLVAAQRVEAAEDLARATLAHGGIPVVAVAQLRLALSSLLFLGGRVGDAVAETDMILAHTGLPDELCDAAEVTRLMGLLALGELAQARAAALAILAGGERPDSQAALAGASTAWAHISWSEERVADALGLTHAAIQRADRGPSTGLRVHPRLLLADMLTALGDFDEADAALTSCSEEIELEGDSLWAAAPAIARSTLDLARGRLGDALAEASAALIASEEVGARGLARPAIRVQAWVAFRRGDLEGTAAHVARLLAPAAPSSESFGPEDLLIEAHLVEARDGTACCLERCGGVFDDLTPLKQLILRNPDAGPWLVRTALAVDDRRRAEGVVACVESLAGDNPTFASLDTRAAHARGLLDRDVSALARAAANHRHPWSRASAAEDAGVALAEVGEAVQARPHFEDALTGYTETGADRDAARVRARLRKVGVRHRHWSNAERPVSGWSSLTDTQRAVAGIVAEGLTNSQVADRMFLSRHTVDFHLRQIFRKLNVASRVELTRQVLEAASGPSPPP
jgi:DNA-binding CsgD family transcriptional regulator